MVQLPLPLGKKTQEVLDAIELEKDVDGLTSNNLGLLYQNSERAFSPATPAGIMALLEEYEIDPEGKNVVIVGHSNVVGKPLAAAFLNKDATVSICHEKTSNISEFTSNADILVSAVGIKGLIQKEIVNRGAIVIDVGLSFDAESKKLVGDVDFEEVEKVASFITPVPGGVGPMTVASLMTNLVNAWKKAQK